MLSQRRPDGKSQRDGGREEKTKNANNGKTDEYVDFFAEEKPGQMHDYRLF